MNKEDSSPWLMGCLMNVERLVGQKKKWKYSEKTHVNALCEPHDLT
jgi:hypothetical protein